jgi:hypothetical protein
MSTDMESRIVATTSTRRSSGTTSGRRRRVAFERNEHDNEFRLDCPDIRGQHGEISGSDRGLFCHSDSCSPLCSHAEFDEQGCPIPKSMIEVDGEIDTDRSESQPARALISNGLRIGPRTAGPTIHPCGMSS